MKTPIKITIGLVTLTALGVGYYLISPLWRVVEMDEPAPSPIANTELQENPEQPLEEIEGTFASHAHEVTGQAIILPADQGQVLRFENFETLNGPDLRIYLATDLTNSDTIDLGPIKATKGNVNYDIPEGTDLTKYKYVLVWCRAFSVLFGAAELQ